MFKETASCFDVMGDLGLSHFPLEASFVAAIMDAPLVVKLLTIIFVTICNAEPLVDYDRGFSRPVNNGPFPELRYRNESFEIFQTPAFDAISAELLEPSSNHAQRDLFSRQRTCLYSNYYLCSDGFTCCPNGSDCMGNGICCPTGQELCGSSACYNPATENCCGNGYHCERPYVCANGRCYPPSYRQCGSTNYYDPATQVCCEGGGTCDRGEACCGNGYCHDPARSICCTGSDRVWTCAPDAQCCDTPGVCRGRGEICCENGSCDAGESCCGNQCCYSFATCGSDGWCSATTTSIRTRTRVQTFTSERVFTRSSTYEVVFTRTSTSEVVVVQSQTPTRSVSMPQIPTPRLPTQADEPTQNGDFGLVCNVTGSVTTGTGTNVACVAAETTFTQAGVMVRVNWIPLSGCIFIFLLIAL
ncbi:hypothetical protein M501DRAFT_287908 [Patellaria atrata CBS 101060]|uniref:Uncharacterized protein n=1 Tax=Patellaria atrata CBS 101060 TaxID=1346257 RepID=A0A9P4VM11_9PEZI|nr:hypothetical protein M501DRAFT_287908 [Patellaria atrata CBS 101060]